MNAVVVLNEDNLPPLKWKLGQVPVFPGTNGIISVADIETSTGIVRKSFSKICPLPKANLVERQAFNGLGACSRIKIIFFSVYVAPTSYFREIL